MKRIFWGIILSLIITNIEPMSSDSVPKKVREIEKQIKTIERRIKKILKEIYEIDDGIRKEATPLSAHITFDECPVSLAAVSKEVSLCPRFEELNRLRKERRKMIKENRGILEPYAADLSICLA